MCFCWIIQAGLLVALPTKKIPPRTSSSVVGVDDVSSFFVGLERFVFSGRPESMQKLSMGSRKKNFLAYSRQLKTRMNMGYILPFLVMYYTVDVGIRRSRVHAMNSKSSPVLT